MTSIRIRDLLAPSYAHVYPAFFDREIPEETDATCDACAMCRPEGTHDDPDRHWFRPDVKCCSYPTSLANFQVGGLLADEDPAFDEGRARIQRRIAERRGVSPLGMLGERDRLMLYDGAEDVFGRSRSLLCPYFDPDRRHCSVWRYRNGVCTTWFCKFVRGAAGARFWQVLKLSLLATELSLAMHVLLELGLDAALVLADSSPAAPLTLAETDGEFEGNLTSARGWGSWSGREEAFFRSAHEIVCALDEGAAAKLGGVRQQALLRALEDAHAGLAPTILPSRLRRNPKAHVYPEPGDRVLVVTFSPTDPVRLRRSLYDALAMFDGTSETQAVMTRLADEHGLRLSEGLLRKLVLQEVLLQPGASPMPCVRELIARHCI